MQRDKAPKKGRPPFEKKRMKEFLSLRRYLFMAPPVSLDQFYHLVAHPVGGSCSSRYTKGSSSRWLSNWIEHPILTEGWVPLRLPAALCTWRAGGEVRICVMTALASSERPKRKHHCSNALLLSRDRLPPLTSFRFGCGWFYTKVEAHPFSSSVQGDCPEKNQEARASRRS